MPFSMSPAARSEQETDTPSLSIGMTPPSLAQPFSPPTPSLETPVLDNDEGGRGDGDDVEQLLDPTSDLDARSGSDPDFPLQDACAARCGSAAEEGGYDTTVLTRSDVRADPILASLAAKQAALDLKYSNSTDGNPPRTASTMTSMRPRTHSRPAPGTAVSGPMQSEKGGFKARLAPATTTQQGLGPRMTKSAALRMGLIRTGSVGHATNRYPVVGCGEGEEGEMNEPRVKRIGLGITLPSLGQPSITPRPTRSSQLRASGEKGSELWPEPHQTTSASASATTARDALILANKEKGRLERLERRKSLALSAQVASLGEPSICVKQTKTSQLRAAGEQGTGLWYEPDSRNTQLKDAERRKEERESMVLELKAKGSKEREERRKTLSTALTSLGQPTILPRENKTSRLRAGGDIGTGLWPEPDKETSIPRGAKEREGVALMNKEKGRFERVERRQSVAMPASLATPSITPRPNKTSMLRNHSSQRSTSSIPAAPSPAPGPARSNSTASLSLTRANSALKVTSADNVDSRAASSSVAGLDENNEGVKDESENVKVDTAMARRASVNGVRSLGAPAITPRLNRAALLRQPAPSTAPTSSAPGAVGDHAKVHRKAASILTPSLARTPSAMVTAAINAQSQASTPSVNSGTGTGPRPTKASLLRAQMGKIPPKIGS